jgi:hypothetical protein
MRKDMILLMQANPQLRALAVQMESDGWFIYANRCDSLIDITTREGWLDEHTQELRDSIHSVLGNYKSSAGKYLPLSDPLA